MIVFRPNVISAVSDSFFNNFYSKKRALEEQSANLHYRATNAPRVCERRARILQVEVSRIYDNFQ